MRYTWEQRIEILRSMNAVGHDRASLMAARNRLTKLARQFPADPEILGIGEMLEMELSGLDWEEQQRVERDAPGRR